MSRPGERFESGKVRVCVRDESFELSVGRTAPIVVDRKGAQQIVHALTYALLATVRIAPLPVPKRPTKRPAAKVKGPAPRSPGPGRPAV